MKLPCKVKSAGGLDDLFVDSVHARCGSIEDGVAFRFGREGGWVVDIEDLRAIVKAADETRDAYRESRCAVCGWHLEARAEDGCVRGNCSYRPRPAKLFDPERADRESLTQRPPPMTDVDVKRLREAALAATQGAWNTGVWIETDGDEWRATGPAHEEHAHDHGSEPGCPDEQAAQRDADYIAAVSPSTVIALLDRIAALEVQESDDLTNQLAQFGDVADLRAQLVAMAAARDEACDIADSAWVFGSSHDEDINKHDRIAALRRVGS
jgi:hypothetical protein